MLARQYNRAMDLLVSALLGGNDEWHLFNKPRFPYCDASYVVGFWGPTTARGRAVRRLGVPALLTCPIYRLLTCNSYMVFGVKQEDSNNNGYARVDREPLSTDCDSRGLLERVGRHDILS